jgi:hypothetical protein
MGYNLKPYIKTPVVCVETGEVFLSQKEAGKSKEIYSFQHICRCCKDKSKTCGGYHWRYASKEEQTLQEGK